MSRRGRWALLGALVALVVSGCRMQLDVDVALQKDGSGQVTVTVELDRDATQQVGGDLRSLLDVDRLVDEGWDIDDPVAGADGSTRLVIEQAFATPGEGAELIASLSGESGPFQDVQLERSSSFWEDRWRIDGTVDFSRGADGATAIDDEAVTRLADQLGASIDRLAQVRVRVRLPGEVTSNATTKADNGAVWAIGLGEGAIDISATGTQRNTSSLVLVAVAVLLTVVGLVVLLVRLAVLREDTRT